MSTRFFRMIEVDPGDFAAPLLIAPVIADPDILTAAYDAAVAFGGAAVLCAEPASWMFAGEPR